MPEGFSSIADMRVVLDAETEKLNGGFALAQGVVSRFAREAQGDLSIFDKAVLAGGEAVLGLKGKLNAVSEALGIAAQAIETFKKSGADLAEAVGAKKEFEALSTEVDKFQSSLVRLVEFQFEEVSDQAGRVAGAFSKLSGSMEASSQNAEGWGNLWQRSLSAVTGGLQYLRDLVDGLIVPDADDFAGFIKIMQEREQARDDRSIVSEQEGALVIEREIEALRTKATTLGMTAAQAAAYNAEQRAYVELARQGLPVTEEATDIIKQQADEVRRLTHVLEANAKAQAEAKEAEARGKRIEEMIGELERQTQAERRRAETLGLTRGQVQALAMEERVLNSVRQSGGELNADQLARIEAAKQTYAAELDAADQRKRALADLDQYTRAVTGSMQSAFRQLTSGTRVDWRDMVSDMLGQIAQLQFNNAVQSLFQPPGGGGGAGGGVANTLISQFTQQLFGGAREHGGPVDAGRVYLVGEKRPELFVPHVGGRIEPSAPAGGSTTIGGITIDARGSTPDSVRELETRLPALVVETIRYHRERGLL